MVKNMARYDDIWSISTAAAVFIVVCLCAETIHVAAGENNAPLTACQHLRSAETRRAKSLATDPTRRTVRIPKCSRNGTFEPIQCSNEINGTECWCVDEYGHEITGTRQDDETKVKCNEDTVAAGLAPCAASSCRMFCPAGFARDARSGCPVCQCRDPCDGIECPGGLACQPQEVQCADEPCPPIPTCKKARSLNDLCPAGSPLTIVDTMRPFLCGHEPGKPACPPLYKCLVQTGNDYGVCCPASITFQKPGDCPSSDDVQTTVDTGVLCGTPCTNDLECPQMDKCCHSNGCGGNCRQPFNVTMCHQARMLSQILSVNEREGRGYVPQCDDTAGGLFAGRQCSRNGLVCWCVDRATGNKIKGSMGAASMVRCDGVVAKTMTGRSQSRSVDGSALRCDQNICASVCEYGFKIDHNGCATCECSEPCEGFRCPAGAHCEVASDPECRSGSALCASEPVCKPDLAYTNPCDIGTPLTSNKTGEVFYCRNEASDEFDSARAFFDDDADDVDVDADDDVASSRALNNNYIECPVEYQCIKLRRESERVCCPLPEPPIVPAIEEQRPQSMCEYLRDFSDRMEGTEAGMVLALPTPTCNADGTYASIICIKKLVKVTRAEQRRILEAKNVRQMRALLATPPSLSNGHECPLYKCSACHFGYKIDGHGCRTCECLPEMDDVKRRHQRSAENLRLVRVDNDESGATGDVEPLDVKSLIKYLRQNILAQPANSEANYMAEILSRKLLNQVVQERSAKVIDAASQFGQQSLDDDAKAMKRVQSPARASVRPPFEAMLIEIEVDECFCVDGFGTEIPGSRGTNVTTTVCNDLRESLECLDITCRMGCDYGFILDATTRCPTCECRDPCDTITCPDGQECRSVEVSCEGEYCPPVPACLPRKPGQCPFLVPPGTEGSTIDSCEYECRSDSHCADAKRCCSNGCGTQCVEPQLKTACQHLQTIQLHQATELGQPAKQKYIAQCNETDGSWAPIQCGPGGVCWCVDTAGNERSGTRVENGKVPNCDVKAARMECPTLKCDACEFGYVVDEMDGCRTCECRDPCAEISCPGGEQCSLIKVECIDEPCPRLPLCIPQRDSVCTEGVPFKRNGQDLVCGPQGDAELCPSTHTCQLEQTSRGVCCAKTRDVCFESVASSCFATAANTTEATSRWRFSPKMNKCVQLQAEQTCQGKNVFHSQSACESVCPVLSQCERLRLRNSLAAKRVQQSLAWFQPRCDPDTGSWSPVQCLGKSSDAVQPNRSAATRNGVSRAFSVNEPRQSQTTAAAVGVCWCADKKGAPVKGSLTRDAEPTCNHRQARQRMATAASIDRSDAIGDPMIEQLINQITLIADGENFIATDYDEDVAANADHRYSSETSAVTERILEIANSIFEEKPNQRSAAISSTQLIVTTTRCHALRATASFAVACDNGGAFEPMQCNDAVCWCVDAAGNQLAHSSTFGVGANRCSFTPIDAVGIELHLPNANRKLYANLYDTLRSELQTLLGDIPENLRVHEHVDGDIYVKFDLTDGNKVDTAFALEEMAKRGELALANGELQPEVTLSRFVHRIAASPMPPAQSAAALMPENTFQMIVFVLATSSAFLVSIFVVFIMLKRGKNKMKSYNTNKTTVGMGDKFLDYSSPIFVLSVSDKMPPHSDDHHNH